MIPSVKITSSRKLELKVNKKILTRTKYIQGFIIISTTNE